MVLLLGLVCCPFLVYAGFLGLRVARACRRNGTLDEDVCRPACMGFSFVLGGSLLAFLGAGTALHAKAVDWEAHLGPALAGARDGFEQTAAFLAPVLVTVGVLLVTRAFAVLAAQLNAQPQPVPVEGD